MRGAVPLALLLSTAAVAAAQEPTATGISERCDFVFEPPRMRLTGSCLTTRSLEIPDGFTLDGDGHTIFALDPVGEPFRGAVILASGLRASVVNIGVSSVMLAAECLTGADRLRGILFDGASGTITGTVVDNVNRRGSPCEEGNGIEVRNLSLDRPQSTVLIEENAVDRYQKSGIVVYGNVNAAIRSNVVGVSGSQDLMPANAIQVGERALARVERNLVRGNSNDSPIVGTAILLQDSAPGTTVVGNTIEGNADVGIYVDATGATVVNNRLTDTGLDGGSDIGIVNKHPGNRFEANAVQGYQKPSMGVVAESAGGPEVG